MIPFIKLRWLWYTLFSLLFVVSVLGFFVRGIPYGIDFTGGTILEIEYTGTVPPVDDVRRILSGLSLENDAVQQTNKGYIMRFGEINDEQKRRLLSGLRMQIGQTSTDTGVMVEPQAGTSIGVSDVNLTFDGQEEGTGNRLLERRFESVGPVIGQELKVRSIQALTLVIFSILLYIAWAFRKVSWPVKSWKYAAVAVFVLFYDVIVTFAAYIWVASFFGWVVDTVFVAGLLTILGYSVSDRIVVFDRIRENLTRMDAPFDEIVNTSVNQTMGRSINTALSTIIVMSVIFIFGGDTLRPFMFTLLFGIILGAVSSVLFASPLLVTWQLHSHKSKK